MIDSPYGLLVEEDYLRILRLLADVAVAKDGSARRRRLAAGGLELVGARYALSAVAQSHGASVVFDHGTVCAVGWDDPAVVQRLIDAHGCRDNPVAGPWLHRLASASSFVALREDLVDDLQWFSSPYVRTVLGPLHVGPSLYGGCRLESHQRLLCLNVYRSGGDERGFEPRDLQRMELLMEVAHRLGRQLDDAECAESDLTPRLRQTLEGLLAGECEKDIAHDLGLRRATVHHYVTELLHRFEVHSVRELIASLLATKEP